MHGIKEMGLGVLSVTRSCQVFAKDSNKGRRGRHIKVMTNSEPEAESNSEQPPSDASEYDAVGGVEVRGGWKNTA